MPIKRCFQLKEISYRAATDAVSLGKKATDVSNPDTGDIILLTISNKQSIFQGKYTKR